MQFFITEVGNLYIDNPIALLRFEQYTRFYLLIKVVHCLPGGVVRMQVSDKRGAKFHT